MTVSLIGSWRAEGVGVAEVEAALGRLRLADRRAAVRTSVLTLVVVVSNDAAGEAALRVITDLGERHPSRAVVVITGEAGEAGGSGLGRGEPGRPLDATATVHAVEHHGSSACFDQIVLRVHGRARHHLDSIVAPLALPDVPVAVWLPATLPSPGDPLLAAADRVVVDSRAVAETPSVDRYGVLPRISSLSRRLPVADLSWARLASWRHLLAAAFDSPLHRPFLSGITGVEVIGHFGPRHLLAGWLQQRLSIDPARFRLEAAEHVSIRISATEGGRAASFAVERPGPERVVNASVVIEGGPCTSQAMLIRRQWPSLALAEALGSMGADHSYVAALEGAATLLARDEAA